MAHQNMPNPSTNKFPPKPSSIEALRAAKVQLEAKRRRQETNIDDTIMKNLSINPKVLTHGPTHYVKKIPNHDPIIEQVKDTLTGPTTQNKTKITQAPPQQTNHPNHNKPSLSINHEIATSKTSTFQTPQNISINKNKLILKDLDDEEMISQGNTETIQIKLSKIEGHQETSSDCEEDMVT